MSDLRKRGRNWYFRFVDASGRRVETKGCPDRRVTEQLAANAEAKAARIKAGLIDPKADGYRRNEARTLADHLADFHSFLRWPRAEPASMPW